MALSWSSKRKTIYFLSIFFAIALPASLFIFLTTHKAPSCFDHKQNQEEEGLDCGGPCELSCATGIGDLVVKWDQSFRVSAGSYNAVAYVENKSDQAGIQKINYLFRLYDKDNILIEDRAGSTFVNPGERFVIFEPRIDTGYRVPVRTFFAFEKDPVWTRTAKNPPRIDVISRTLADVDSAPRLTVTLKNSNLIPVKDIQVLAVLYDKNGNAVSSSATYIDDFPRTSEKQITFTWPDPLTAEVSRIEVIPRVDIFAIKTPF